MSKHQVVDVKDQVQIMNWFNWDSIDASTEAEYEKKFYDFFKETVNPKAA
jgi:hypothetical protein